MYLGWSTPGRVYIVIFWSRAMFQTCPGVSRGSSLLWWWSWNCGRCRSECLCTSWESGFFAVAGAEITEIIQVLQKCLEPEPRLKHLEISPTDCSDWTLLAILGILESSMVEARLSKLVPGLVGSRAAVTVHKVCWRAHDPCINIRSSQNVCNHII